MLYNVPESKIEQWKWSRPRLPELLELCKQYEEKILNGGATFLYKDLAKAFGYSPEIREVKENNFRNIINSDLALLDPYRVDGIRIIVGFDGWSKDGRRLITVSCIHSYKPDLTELKLFKDINCKGDGNNGGENCGDIQNMVNGMVNSPIIEIRDNRENEEFKIADSLLDVDKLPEKYKKQLEEKLQGNPKEEADNNNTESI